ncbi:MAG: T9SS type A sorting domain-containing protein [candidate division KSB1 bacterium]|nr:T9SS type A sorting domain-containing protein [candidate division KSB1 bacterium]
MLKDNNINNTKNDRAQTNSFTNYIDLGVSTHFSNPVSTIPTGAEEETIPEKCALHENFPNPFNPTTTLRYDLPQDAHVTCVVYNVQGQKLATLIDSHKPAGEHAYTWNAAERFSSGLYIIVMRAGEHVFKQKVSLVK